MDYEKCVLEEEHLAHVWSDAKGKDLYCKGVSHYYKHCGDTAIGHESHYWKAVAGVKLCDGTKDPSLPERTQKICGYRVPHVSHEWAPFPLTEPGYYCHGKVYN